MMLAPLLAVILLPVCSSYLHSIPQRRNLSPLLLSDENLVNSPGYTSESPVDLATLSCRESMKVAVGLVVTWLLWDAKMKEIMSKVRSKTSPSAQEITLPNGIRFSDEESSRNLLTSMPRKGEKVRLLNNLWLNGLKVPVEGNSGYTNFIWGTPEVEQLAELPNLATCITGLPLGVRRWVTVPSDLAFGDTGMPPFIPSNTGVTYELLLEKVD